LPLRGERASGTHEQEMTMARSWLLCRVVALGMLASMLGAAGCSRSADSPGAEAAATAWRFLKVDGAVTVDGKAAAAGTAIGKTSTITAADGAHALITVGTGSIVEVRSGAKLTLGSSPRKKISVRLAAGQLWSFFGGATDYEVVTDTAVAGVRGTIFFVDANQKDRTIVCACSHEVHLQGAGNDEAIDVNAKDWEHLGTAFVRQGDTVQRQSLGALSNPPNHPDAEGKAILAQMPR